MDILLSTSTDRLPPHPPRHGETRRDTGTREAKSGRGMLASLGAPDKGYRFVFV